MRIVVTGASGNVGTALLRRLRSEPGVTEITGIARRIPPVDAGEPYDAADWTSCDVGTDAAVETLATAFEGATAVVHLAWQIQPSHDRELLRRTNVAGTRNAAEAAVRAGVPAFVYASSLGAYSPGPKDDYVDESWPVGGIRGSSYSEDKAATEALLDRVERKNDIRVVRLRPGLIFQRDAASGIARYFAGPLAPLTLLRFERLPVVPSSLELRAQALHADDVAEAYARATFADVRGSFNVAADPLVTPENVAERFGGRTVPVPPRLLLEGAKATWRARLQPTEPGWVRLARGAPLMDCSRARRELDWDPRHDALAALAEVFAGMAAGTGTRSPALRPREDVPSRVRALTRGHLPGHDRYP